ncbi:ATP-dependent DNA helicase RecG [Labrys wisconsinensis]|uniref:ATP-dependent DNA helicase RecG n=1 Tax=Labrys wisconsinensis TaxID=425677 RepID=A0ABU0J3H9_9HYPH|nr:ATP-dependent DNA helicase RecG [Labrys wisconsinensis]MDQ0468820.1 ATP-dependent DNA helicase RecG [Labrys wisconsinensis]
MRPAILNPLFASVSTLAGVGPARVKTFARLLGGSGPAGPRVLDLLVHLPVNVLDRRLRPKLAEAPLDTLVTVEVAVDRYRPGGRAGAPLRVYCHDETGELTLVFFSAQSAWIERSLPLGARRWVSGRIELYDGMMQMVHPDRIVDEAGLAALPAVEPIYPLTEGLGGRAVQRAVQDALAKLPVLPEWQEPDWLRMRAWPPFGEALATLHRPEGPEATAPDTPARMRLAYDELLASQLALVMVRAQMKRLGGRSTVGDGRIAGKIEAALPFALTRSQAAALTEIRADLAAETRMLRLLQGDVGSGKTVVALLAMATAVEAGRQAAIMAPTEILARQHLATMAPLAEAAGLTVALLTGREKGRERSRVLDGLRAGTIDILAGTHALFQDGVDFRDLGLAVVDEQHRFGVHQRLALARKGEAVDVLVMTATPIPRTLVLTYFGDMDASALTEKPAGRKPVDTRLISLDRLDEVVAAVGRMLATGARVYWVCPLVSESEELDLAAAEDRHRHLAGVFGDAADLLHGQMKAAAKDAAMARFSAGETGLLVSTTVIEVGVNVPEATVMVIEHAERFGLSQLHQLRGRIGRGAERSTCLLLYRGPLGETAKRRLEIMRETEDGFRIAEEDLKLRGEGDVLGTRQSGLPGFRLARLEAHGALLAVARDDAKLILGRDPELTGGRGEALRTLLYLFERDEAVRLLRAG